VFLAETERAMTQYAVLNVNPAHFWTFLIQECNLVLSFNLLGPPRLLKGIYSSSFSMNKRFGCQMQDDGAWKRGNNAMGLGVFVGFLWWACI